MVCGRDTKVGGAMEINPEKVCYVIIKAREFDVKVPPEEPDPGSNPADEDERVVLQDYQNDPVYQELKTFIDDLNDDERLDLVALMWIGRGTYTADEWETAIDQARQSVERDTADYLLGEPLLGDFLEEGLAEFDLSCEDFETGHL